MKTTSAKRPVRVGLISLGCAKNLVDAEIMLGSLLKSGIAITNDAAQADAVIVNTCSFIDSAQEESVDTILESAEVREAKNRGQALIVSGCLTQRFRDELPELFPEVDAFMGIDQVAQVAEIVGQAITHRTQSSKLQAPSSRETSNSKNKKQIVSRFAEIEGANPQSAIRNPQSNAPVFDVAARPTFIPDFATPRFRLTPKHFAYVKIAEGCNHPCSFCIIPQMRGSHRSRRQNDIVAEAKQLIAEGVKELNLISQDSTYYGLDLRANHTRAISSPERFSAATKSLAVDATTICSLLRELNSLEGVFWIRLLYTHPAHWTDELIQAIADCPKVARYVDIPLQHIHENMLERMRRETSQQYIVDLLKRIRAGIPGIALRTTFIVGFPGETEEYFQTLLEFIRETKFERLGVFTYSQEENTRAGKMAGQIPDKTKRRRRKLAMKLQHRVAAEISKSFVGKTIRVLVEKEAGAKEVQNLNVSSWEHGQLRDATTENLKLKTENFWVARGEADAPDIDGRVFVRVPRGGMPVGEFAQVRIIAHTDYDLIAEPV